ncbi:hypothetical protein MMC28_002939 [Mycoblastus sanguinarius]|nr:hypothetical protein [Mycoblastus sanguinarius]
MKGLLVYAFLAVAVSAAPRFHERDTDDDDCSMVWVTVYGDAPSSVAAGADLATPTDGVSSGTMSAITATASMPAAGGLDASNDGVYNKIAVALPGSSSGLDTSPPASSSPSAVGSGTLSSATSTSDNSSALSLPTRPDGSTPLPVNGDHVSAPVATDAVPAGAATYTPPTAGVFNNTDFASWMQQQKSSNLPSKWMKVAPGTYRYALGPVMPAGQDPNNVNGENIVLFLFQGGWTLDLRGVTFMVDITTQNQQQRPGDMIYINQSENLTILGGTIWIDQGEQFTQARVTSVGAADSSGTQLATMQVEQGYNTSIWSSADPRNQGCVDSSNPSHFKLINCNFWKVSAYDFSTLSTAKTFTATLSPGSAIQPGYVLTMQVGAGAAVVGGNSLTAISTEDNGSLHVKGFTSNGYVASIGLNTKVPPIFEDVYYVNPPPRPGYAPRVNGPALSWGNIGGFLYEPAGQAQAQVPGSYWQVTGCEMDLQAASNMTIPTS